MNTPIALLYQSGLKIPSFQNLVRAKAMRGSFELGVDEFEDILVLGSKISLMKIKKMI